LPRLPRSRSAMSTCVELRTPLRRPCLLRHLVESNVDAPECKLAVPMGGISRARDVAHHSASVPVHRNIREGAGMTSGGGGAPDSRSITLDMPANISPRCSGLRRGNLGAPPENMHNSKQDQRRTLQALSIGNFCDVDNMLNRGAARSPRDGNGEGRQRTKHEGLQGMPLAGSGADIDLCSGRRCSPRAQSREVTPFEEKTGLDRVCITQQFQRRHFSPESRTKSYGDESRLGDSEHITKAQSYANLIGRPKIAGKATKDSRPTLTRTSSMPPFKLRLSRLKDGLFDNIPAGALSARRANDSHAEPGDHELAKIASECAPVSMTVLRTAVKNTSSTTGLSTLLDEIAEHQELPDDPEPNLLTATAGSGNDISTGARHALTRNKNSALESPQKSPGASSFRSIASDISTASPDGSAGSISAYSSPLASARRRQQAKARHGVPGKAMGVLQEELRKANRRAAWVG